MSPPTIAVIHLAQQPVYRAPDGSQIRELAKLKAASVAHCRLDPGAVTIAVRHRTVEEIWFVMSGRGQMWQASEGSPGDVVELVPGACLTVPLGSSFQFRAGDEPLQLLLTTAPPWPGDGEAFPVTGVWQPTIT